jgi:hypothetical protein
MSVLRDAFPLALDPQKTLNTFLIRQKFYMWYALKLDEIIKKT